MKRIFYLALLASVLFTACKKEKSPEYNSNVKATLTLEFDNVVGSSDLLLNTSSYTNAVGESFKVTKFKYFISNIKMTSIDGTVYTVPQDSCYFLIDESIAGTHKPELHIPEGEYKTLSFVLGVDSLRNTSDISKRNGALDVSGPAIDMYWSWNSGYIFFRLDGTSPAIASMGGVLQYHIGGFGGYATATVNNLRNYTLDLTKRGTPKVKAGKSANVHLMVDILKALNGTTNMSFAAAPMVHSPNAGVPVANNYVNMISHDHTEN